LRKPPLTWRSVRFSIASYPSTSRERAWDSGLGTWARAVSLRPLSESRACHVQEHQRARPIEVDVAVSETDRDPSRTRRRQTIQPLFSFRSLRSPREFFLFHESRCAAESYRSSASNSTWIRRNALLPASKSQRTGQQTESP